MTSDLVALADASRLLGMSPERVRQLVVAGDLPGIKFGNAWAVPRSAVAARGHVANRRGRPLGERRVWHVIGSGAIDLSNVSRYRNRGMVERYSMALADAEYLINNLGAVQSGAAGAVFHGQMLQVDGPRIECYMSQSTLEQSKASVAAVHDPFGSVVVRSVPDAVWADVEALAPTTESGRRIAPAGAVALDLMDSGDARHWVAAEALVQAR